jgi:hypothetical protein
MICRSLIVGALMVLLAGSTSAQDGPRLRIITGSGPVANPHKMYFGGFEVLYAVPASALDEALHPSRALRDVEWWAYRTFDMRASHPRAADKAGQEIAHRKPRSGQWGGAPRPFVCPDDLLHRLSSGRYLIRAVHPKFGRAEFEITLASLLLVGHDPSISADSYEVSFFISLADPDLTGPDLAIDLRIIGRDGHTLDRQPGARLVRKGVAYRSPRRIRLSSRVPPPESVEADAAAQVGPLHIMPDSSLRLAFGDRVFEFPLPLEIGPLVRRNDATSTGREGDVREGGSLVDRLRKRNKNGKNARNGSPTARGHGRTPTGDRGGKPMQIVSTAGPARRVKVWMGESPVFAARLRPTGPGDLFGHSVWLRDVFWTLTRYSTPLGREPDAIARGVGSLVVGRLYPKGLWGDPPSVFNCPRDVQGSWKPARYILRADRRGSPPAEVRVDVASFTVINVNAELRAGFYTAALQFRLEDPSETRDRVPLVVQIVSGRGEIVDYVRGVSLVRVRSNRSTLDSSRVIMSSQVARPNRTRYEETDPKKRPVPGTPCVLLARPGCQLRVVLGGTVFTYPLPLIVSEVIAGGTHTDPRMGR